MMPAPKRNTVTEILEMAAGQQELGARFLNRDGEEAFHPYPEVFERAKAAAAWLRGAGLKRGDRVAILLPTSIQFFDAFLGVQLAGGVPAALYPPVRLGRLDEYFARLGRMLTKIAASFLITDARIRSIIGPGVENAPCVRHVVDVDQLIQNGAARCVGWTPDTPDPEEIAFLQFSSGSTSEPKAVMVTHRNLVENLEMMRNAISPHDEEGAAKEAVCWLPLYHDMGLVGCLYLGLYYPGTVTYLRPEKFVAKPSLWLQAISRYRAVISAAPDFAYGLCLKRVRDNELNDVDLSSWRMALNGAEQINAVTMAQFAERFSRWGFRPEALTPVYGMAEAGLAVTFSSFDHPPLVTEFDREALTAERRAVPGPGRRLVSVGQPLPGVEVKICDENGHLLPEARVGTIKIRGRSVSNGYYADPETTAHTIQDGWLDTGDLGFFLDDNLYISGRAKDLIILRGRNYAPQEIEELVYGLEGVRTGAVVAVSALDEDNAEQLIVLAEKDSLSRRSEEEIVADVRSHILAGISLAPDHIDVLEPGTLPRTSSGKFRRADALQQYLAGELTPPSKVTALKLLKDLGRSQISWMRVHRRQREN